MKTVFIARVLLDYLMLLSYILKLHRQWDIHTTQDEHHLTITYTYFQCICEYVRLRLRHNVILFNQNISFQ